MAPDRAPVVPQQADQPRTGIDSQRIVRGAPMSQNGINRSEIRRAVNLSFAAEYLGVSVQSIRRRIAEGALPAFRIGPRSIRVYIDDLDALKNRVSHLSV